MAEEGTNTALIIYDGQEYWRIMTRYNRFRKDNKAIGPTAVRDMRKLEVHNPAILRRVAAFTARFPAPVDQNT